MPFEDSTRTLPNTSFSLPFQSTRSVVIGAGVGFVVAAVFVCRFVFGLFCLAFIHSSTIANRAAKSFISTGTGSSCGFTSKA